MSAFLSPIGGAAAQFFNNQGVIAAGGFIYTYLAGTTTPYPTWTDSGQGVPCGNPIVLNSYGRPTTEIWLQSGIAYKFVLTDSLGNPLTPGTYDNIVGINVSSLSQSEWVSSALTPTYVSTNAFTLPGNQTSVYDSNRRVQFFTSSGAFYGYVSGSTYNATTMLTTISVVPDSGVLDNTVTSVNYALLNGQNTSVPEQYLQQGVPINNTVVGNITPVAGTFTTLTSNNVVITGGTISGIAGFSVPDFLYLNQGIS
jgi:hypothetical protein